ncbi:MAG TPA: YfhO family protein [Candidatus Kapabacteria bacterium]|nr:YfhO family protein [Candidatus Kapabacteria bacterium]
MATNRSTPARRPNTTRRPATPRTDSRSPLDKIPEKYLTPIYIGLILVSLLVFFGGVIFTGKYFATNDNISWLSFVPYLDQMAAKGEHPFWLPYIFSGMPGFAAYLVTGERAWDISMWLLDKIEHIFAFGNFWLMRVVFFYFIYGIGMYLLMRTKQFARSTSFYVALAAMFSTWIIVYIMIGHNTKIGVLMTFPFVFMCLERLLQRWSLLYAGLLILVVHVMMEQNHPQTAFYGAAAVGIYMLFKGIESLMAASGKQLLRFGTTVGVLVVAGLFAYGMGLDRYNAISEYTPYSTRGAKALVQDKADADQQEDGGHGYKYATDWSFSPEETITYLIPSYYGFGKIDVSGPGIEPQKAMTYWGQMPFTDAGHYAGIGVLLLALLGIWAYRRNMFVWSLVAIGLFGLVLSFGKNMSFLYDLFYYHFPSFSKFRAPSQSLVLLEFVLPILAGFGLHAIVMARNGENWERAAKKLLRTTIVFGGAMLLGFLLFTAMKESYMQSMTESVTAKGAQDLLQLKDVIYGNASTDFLLTILFGTGTLLVAWLYVNQKLAPVFFTGILFVVLIADLWRQDWRPMEATPWSQATAVFNPTDVDSFLAQDTSKYRILDLTAPGPNFPARQLHEHILGYHAAKMRNYQDLMDIAGNGNYVTATLGWDILNTKYVISPTNDPRELDKVFPGASEQLKPVFTSKEKQTFVFENTHMLPRAWFVNRVDVADARTTLEKIRDHAFDPRDVAYVTAPLKEPVQPVGYVPAAAQHHDTAAAPAHPADSAAAPAAAPAAVPAPAAASGKGSASVASYDANHFTLNVEAPATNFLVISEIHYPPSWKATIDGKPADVIQTNYVLRGLVIPPGKHTVEMHFESAGFQTGKTASMVLNLVTFGIIGAGFWMQRRNRTAGTAAEPAADAGPDGQTAA